MHVIDDITNESVITGIISGIISDKTLDFPGGCLSLMCNESNGDIGFNKVMVILDLTK